LEIPVFSVDYRLSPESRFPDALNDCWQVYFWLLEQGEKHFGIRIDNIILAGDSAGGNLIAALTLLCIRKGYKLPLALVMSYPAAYVGPAKFTPSLLLSLDDVLLPSKFLKHALAAYAGKIAEQDPQCTGD
jgi:hormone-sensitive lipase